LLLDDFKSWANDYPEYIHFLLSSERLLAQGKGKEKAEPSEEEKKLMKGKEKKKKRKTNKDPL